MPAQTIPLQPQAQNLAITLGNVNYNLTVRWSVPNNSWMLDVLDSNGDPVACGIPLVTGADLLGQLAYLGIGGASPGQLQVQTTNNTDAVPTFGNLGTEGNLYWVTP